MNYTIFSEKSGNSNTQLIILKTIKDASINPSLYPGSFLQSSGKYFDLQLMNVILVWVSKDEHTLNMVRYRICC